MKKINDWIPAIIVMLVIFGLSSMEGQVVKATGFGHESYQVNAHFILYLLLSLALYKALKDIPKTIFWAIIYSMTDELHQVFVPGRSWQLKDLVVDLFGILLGGLIVWKSQYLLPKTLKNWLKK